MEKNKYKYIKKAKSQKLKKTIVVVFQKLLEKKYDKNRNKKEIHQKNCW